MSVKIGHASISENGTVNGTAGDSTGKEVCERDWYSKPWGFVAIHPDATVREAIATAIEQACANDKIGYSQDTRNTLYTQAKAKSYDLSKITTACNCDCSSLVNVAVVCAGLGSYGSNGWTTSTMQTQLKALGFEIVTSYLTSSAYCVRGAIYCKAGSHVVVGLDNGSSYATMLSKAGVTDGLTVDGSLGKASVTRWQEVMGTTQDGYVSNQSTASKAYHSACSSSVWKYSTSTSGSSLIKAWQTYLNKENNAGLEVDGKFGKNTIKATQTYLNKVNSAGLSVDGKCGSNTAKALQTWLNKQ